MLEALARRALARKEQDYETADAIEAELREERHVVLDDKQGTWRVAQMFGGYIRTGPRVDALTTAQVGELLARRTDHQEAREYEEADALQAELAEMGVTLNTRSKTWRLGGKQERRGGSWRGARGGGGRGGGRGGGTGGGRSGGWGGRGRSW